MEMKEFNPSQSDGCSIPHALRIILPPETPAQRACCVAHDGAYFCGGSKLDRAIADAELLICLLHTGMDVDLAQICFSAVRSFGKAHWNDGKGNKGRYSDDPPDEIAPDPMSAHPWNE